MWFRAFTASILTNIEQRKQPFISWLFSFIAIVGLRMYLEDFRTKTGGFFQPVNQLHEFLFYVVVFIFVAVMFSYVTRERIGNIAKVLTRFSPVLLIAPVVDYLLTLGHGFPVGYVRDFSIQPLWQRFLTLGGTWQGGGATPGVKVEIVFILVGIFLYIWVKTQRPLRALFSSFSFYCFLGILASFPAWARAIFIVRYGASETLLFEIGNKFFILIILVLLLLLYIRHAKRQFFTLVHALRFSRIVFYLTLAGAGLWLSLTTVLRVTPTGELIINSILLVIAIILSSIYLMVVNDKEDEAGDRITNPDRIIPKQTIDLRQYTRIGYVALGGALLLSAAVGLEVFFLIALGNALFTVYSVSPFAFKRNFVLSKVAIAIVTILVMTSGYLLNTTGCSAFLPTSIIIALFIAVFLAANVIDLKDTAGDRASGVRTLSVRFGDRTARFVVAVLIIFGFSLLPFILNVRSGFAGAVLLGIVTSASLFLRPYREWATFLCFVITLGYFSVLVLGLA